MNVRTLLSGLLAAVVITSFTLASHYHGKYAEERSRANAAENLAATRQATINDMLDRQKILAELDKRHTRELEDAKSENDALRRRLDNGGRVLVKGKCPVREATQPTGTGSLGNDAAVELSPVAGRNVLDIRSGIISDQQKVRYLQDYISTQCLK